MSPQVKGAELYNKFFYEMLGDSLAHQLLARECALICCDGIIESYNQTKKDSNLYDSGSVICISSDDSIRFWQMVKSHIQSL